MAPLIAVVGHYLEKGRIEKWRHGGYAVPEGYVDGVRRAGGVPVVVQPADLLPLDDRLDAFGGVVIVGGGDIHPRFYDGADHRRIYGVDEPRDEAEIDLARAVVARDIPTLAICRGIQVLNVAFGGSLLPHLGDVSGLGDHGMPGQGAAVHEVRLEAGSAVAAACGGRDRVQVSCHHHQAVDVVGAGLRVTGRAADGVVEAVEVARVLAVQWHPEDTAGDDPANQGLFDTLVTMAAG